MQENTTLTLDEYKLKIKEIGYKAKPKRYSEFIGVFYYQGNRKLAVGSGSVFSATDLEEHKTLIEVRNKYRGKVYDGMTKVVV